MNIEKFVREFADQYDDISTENFTAETKFKENDEWSSMTALSVIAMVDESYSVRLTGDDVRKSTTIQDIYDIVSLKVNG
ncbi:acyl carrier protein [Mucilaginibacter sp. ZT4R22]|uniref:Acyl carrier protein n=1 Tax=Mucilaginibacter pankratovii TaxID=2772110 RepID=A0ABR7WNX2_9SPHI|nr:acyl carrier protein [Mucilaginibacter pankratovii]MBD1363987.1 acyl carrier protein [Mucilaginibacter pankratovii]